MVSLIVILNLFIAALFIGGGEGGTRNLLHFVTFKQWFYVNCGGARWCGEPVLYVGRSCVKGKGGGAVLRVAADSPRHARFLRKRVLNIVEEIALAAGVPVPPVYLLPENDINAFAAGYKLSDAVIG